MKKALLSLITISSFISITFAQTESDLIRAFEGKRVEVLIEMPATSEGIDLNLNDVQPLDFNKYSDRIKEFGIALYPGDQILITKIKVKKKHIEFHLAGGGYGTFWDESTYVSSDHVNKSNREKELEDLLNDKDKELSNRKELQDELDDLRDRRQREQRSNDRQAALESEMKKQRIEDKRLQGGSRFNIHLGRKVEPKDMSPQAIKSILSEYVNFDPNSSPTDIDPVSPGSLRKGISIEDAMGLYGVPKGLKSKNECGIELTECHFVNDDQKISALFAEGVLVKYTIESN